MRDGACHAGNRLAVLSAPPTCCRRGRRHPSTSIALLPSVLFHTLALRTHEEEGGEVDAEEEDDETGRGGGEAGGAGDAAAKMLENLRTYT